MTETDIPVETTREPGTAGEIQYAKAGIMNRVAAVLLDMLVMLPIWYVFYLSGMARVGGLVTLAYSLFKDGIDFAGLDNRSIGKKIMGLRVMNPATGQRCTYVDSLLRQFMFIIPIINIFAVILEFILVLANDKGIRLGDKLAKTMVIEEA